MGLKQRQFEANDKEQEIIIMVYINWSVTNVNNKERT